jgi:hypothetical protein
MLEHALLGGGAGRDRTGDLRLAKAALSQLSYSPPGMNLVGLSGFEPLTSRLSAVRSNQLSYRPVVVPGPGPSQGRPRSFGCEMGFKEHKGRPEAAFPEERVVP